MNPWRVARWLWLAAVAVIYGLHLGGPALWDVDEAIYADIARHMAESGDWVLPVFNGAPRFDKPPLLMWAQAAAMRLVGVGELAARLPSYVFGLAGVALAGALGARFFSERAGLFASFVLATSLLWFAESRIGLLDTALSVWIAAALCLVHRIDEGHAPSHLALWGVLALGVLTKGPVAVVLVGAASLAAMGWRRWWRHVASRWSLAGLAVFAAVALPWHAAVYARAGEPWVQDYFGYHMWTRFTQPIEAHGYPWYFYLPVLAAGMLPWTGLGAAALWAAVAQRPALRRAVSPANSGRTRASGAAVPPRRLLAWWAGAVLLFFSLSRTKLPGYILPAFLPLAVLLGSWLDDMTSRPVGLPGGARERWRENLLAMGLWATAGFSLLGAAALGLARPQVPESYLPVLRLVWGLPLGMAAASILAALLRRPGRPSAAAVVGLAGASGALLLWVGGWMLPAVDQLRPVRTLALAARPYAQEGVPVISALGDASSSFYTRSSVVYLTTPQEVARQLQQSGPPALALVPTAWVAQLAQMVPELQVLDQAASAHLVGVGPLPGLPAGARSSAAATVGEPRHAAR